MNWKRATDACSHSGGALVYLHKMPTTKTPPQNLPQTLGELRTSNWTAERVSRSVKDELRDNLIAKLRTKEPIFRALSAMKTRSFRRL